MYITKNFTKMKRRIESHLANEQFIFHVLRLASAALGRKRKVIKINNTQNQLLTKL